MNNILLITMDQLSLHALSCYKESYLSNTPAIDSLAGDGIKFTNCHTPCALCTPARASILTGLYPHNHGALHNSGVINPFSEKEIGQRLELFPQKLLQAGYNLGYQGKWHAGVSSTANDAGFQGFGPADYGHYKESPRYKEYLKENGLEPVEEVIDFRAQSEENWMDSAGYVTGDLRATGSYFLTEETITMIDSYKDQEKPFFQWLSFWGPHAPYWPHESYLDDYNPEDIKKWNSFDEDWRNKPQVHQRFRESVMPHASHADWKQWSIIISRYYAQTRMIDDQICRLLEHLKKANLYTSTTIIFTADHGDSLGIHGGTFDKGPMAFEEIYNIPLIVKLPESQRSGTVETGFVSLLDLAPTICHIGETAMSEEDGTSILPLLQGKEFENRDDFLAEFHGHRFPVGQRILWWKNYKFILNFADIDELYNLRKDPDELVNLCNSEESKLIKSEMQLRMLTNLHENHDNLHPQAYLLLSS